MRQRGAVLLALCKGLCQTTLPIVMAKSKSGQAEPAADSSAKKVNLRELAEHLGLSVATVSLVMNRSPAAKSIPQADTAASARSGAGT